MQSGLRSPGHVGKSIWTLAKISLRQPCKNDQSHQCNTRGSRAICEHIQMFSRTCFVSQNLLCSVFTVARSASPPSHLNTTRNNVWCFPKSAATWSLKIRIQRGVLCRAGIREIERSTPGTWFSISQTKHHKREAPCMVDHRLARWNSCVCGLLVQLVRGR